MIVASVAGLVLGAAFAWSAFAKLLSYARWREALERYRLPAPRVMAVAVPAIEAVVATLLLTGNTRAGGAAALGLLGAFSVAVLRARALEGDRLPCGCFGGTEARDYRTMLARNALLGIAGGLALAPGRNVELLEGIHAPDRSDAVPVLLLLLAVVLVAWLTSVATRTLRGER